MKWHKEHREQIAEKIDADKAKLNQLNIQLEELSEKKKKALDRKIKAEKNEILCSIEEITKSLEAAFLQLKKKLRSIIII